MKVVLQRIEHNHTATIGELYIDGVFECFICEDEPRDKKVIGETRIPAGTYELKLRLWGKHHEAYRKKFAGWHVGMIEITGVKTHQGILYHIGNSEKDTMGCPLPGTARNPQKPFEVINSTIAYEKSYRKIAPKLVSGERIFIEVIDELDKTVVVE